ncbi:11392_t:CDS:1 [Funneliformis caledonium]|uniref:11392_t:CDS:1 n=1 Tax=Funneliformis caledonium TaxID=1117310 RepID=A0A9N9C9V8_9GLOM|nr:11392_t:CDS:1 [Funneliformis caledonium]
MAHSTSNDKKHNTDTKISIMSTITLPSFPENETNSHSFYNCIFTKIANFLLYHTRFHLPTERTFKFLEIEFYLNDATNDHNDPYSHGHEQQLTCGEWYFHHVGKNGYRGGSRKGIDITFGSVDRKIYGGILIRAIQDELTNEVIEGPSLIVDKILETCGVNQQGGIREMVEIVWKGKSGVLRDTDNSTGVVYLTQINEDLTDDEVFGRDKKRLRYSTGLTSPYFKQKSRKKSSDTRLERNNNASEKMYTSPRVGITLSNEMPSTNLRLQYLLKPYRYFTLPHLLKKGKAQLVIGMYDHFKEINKVADVANISRFQVEKYIHEMTNGLKEGNLEEFIGKKGKGLNGIEYCRMAGTVKKWEQNKYG